MKWKGVFRTNYSSINLIQQVLVQEGGNVLSDGCGVEDPVARLVRDDLDEVSFVESCLVAEDLLDEAHVLNWLFNF